MDYNNTEFCEPKENKVVSAKTWFLYILVCLIPIVNVVFLLTNALSEKSDANVRNFSKAALIWVLVSITLVLLGLMYFVNMIR